MPETTPPRIWLLISDKPGDNAQIELIAEHLGLPYEIRRVLPKPEYVLGKPRFEVTLSHLDPAHSDKLQPPWPDLILTIGRRPAMAALWIKEQSGGHSKIVLLGRPKRWQERFDLIIVSSQYHIPPDERVLQLDLPLMRSHEEEIAKAVDTWRERLDGLPRPLTALFVGGQTLPFRFDADTARTLLHQATAAAGEGHLYISTSRRTAPEVADALEQDLPPNATLFRWSINATENPYFALLGQADRFIVTGDSVSMMVEVAQLSKPLAIFALPYQKGIIPRLQKLLNNRLYGGASNDISSRILQRLVRVLHRAGLIRHLRNLNAVHQLFYNKRLATPLGEAFLPESSKPEDELQSVIDRIRSIFETKDLS